MEAENLESTKYVPIYYVWDHSVLGTALATEVQEAISNEEDKLDFMVIKREALDAAGGGGAKGAKKPPPKGKKGEAATEPEEEEDDNASVTLNDAMLQAITDTVQKEATRRQDLLYAQRKAAIEKLGGGAAAGKGAKAAKDKKPAKPADKKTAKGAKGTEEKDEIEPPKAAAPKAYPATLPLHIHLDGVIKKVGDAEKLLESNVLINTIVIFKPPAKLMSTKEREFQYGDPLTEDGEKEEKKSDEAEGLSSGPATGRNAFPPEAVPEVSLAEQLLALRDTNEKLQDVGVVDVEVPRKVMEMKKPDDTGDDSRPPTSSSKKTAKKPAKAATAKGKGGADEGKGDSAPDNSSVVQELAVACVLALRQASQDQSDFAAWKKGATITEIPTAKPWSEVDTRLYNNLMSKVPDSCSSVSLLLHCMFEQVAANVANTNLQSMFTNDKINQLEAYLDDALSNILATNMADDEGAEDAESEEESVNWGDEEGLPESEPLPDPDLDPWAEEAEAEAPYPLSPVVPKLRGDLVAAGDAPGRKDFGEFCPATMGEPCVYQDGVCEACGGQQSDEAQRKVSVAEEFEKMSADDTWAVAGDSGFAEPVPKTAENKKKSASPPKPKVIVKSVRPRKPLSTTVLKYGDQRRIVQAIHCLEAGKSWEEFPLTDQVEEILKYARLPGVARAGMPDSSAQSVSERGITRTEMLNLSILPAEVFETGLMNLTLEEMLDVPGPAVEFTLHKNTEFFLVDHLYRESKIIEAAVKMRIDEIRDKARNAAAEKEKFGTPGFEGPKIGEEDEIVEQARIKWDWHLGDREFREEIAPDILPQVLAQALDVTGTVHTQARYEPLTDCLYLVMHARTPLTRRRTIMWQSFLAPQINFNTWGRTPIEIKKMKPETLYAFNNGHTGRLRQTAHVMYPRDGARMGLTVSDSGAKQLNTVWVQKDDEIVYMHSPSGGSESSSLTVTWADRSFMFVSCNTDPNSCDGTIPLFNYTTTSGLLITITPAGQVYMSYPGDVKKQSPAASDGQQSEDPEVVKDKSITGVGKQGETWRCLETNGVVTKKMKDGKLILLLSDANSGVYNMQAESWEFTNNVGQKVSLNNKNEQALVGTIEVAQQLDPETGAVVITREDLSMLIRYRDGSMLAQHADGTRVYTDLFPSPDKKRHLVECPDFPPVTVDVEKRVSLGGVNHVVPRTGATGRNLRTLERQTGKQEVGGGLQENWEHNIIINLTDGTVIRKRAPQGGVVVTRPDGARMVCCPNGKLIYLPRSVPVENVATALANAEYEDHGIPRECYNFDLLQGTLRLYDNEDNKFHANLDRTWDAKLSREQSVGADASNVLDPKYFPPPENPIQPRIFVVRGNGTAAELLSPQSVSAYLNAVNKDPRCRQVPAELLDGNNAGGDSDDIMEVDGFAENISAPLSLKFLKTLPAPVSYNRKPVIPNIVKAAPNVFTVEEKPRHSFIVYRHLIRSPGITTEQREQVLAERESFADWKADQAKNDLDFQTKDPRPAEEIEEEKRLQIEVLTARARRKEQQLGSTLKEHDNTAASNARQLPTRPGTMDNVNVGSTLTSVYEPPKKVPVTTTPMSTRNGDGTREPVKFFKQKPDSGLGATKPITLKESTASSKKKGKKNPELGPFFSNSIFKQRFTIKEVLVQMKLCCHPLYQNGMSQDELENAAADMSAQEAEVNTNKHFSKLSSVVEGVNQLAQLVARIFTRPHDPTLRTVDLSRTPYDAILKGSDIIDKYAKSILQTLGFQDNGNILVLMEDDLFVKDGIRSLTNHMKEVVRRPGDGERASGTDSSSNRKKYSIDDNMDDEDSTPAVEEEEPKPLRSKAYLEREARMKATLQSPTVHNRHTFEYDNFQKSMAQHTMGDRSRNLPEQHPDFGDTKMAYNTEYINREAPVKRPTKTVSVVNSALADAAGGMPTFEFDPWQVNFGEVRTGCTYRITCSLSNIGNEPGRFQMKVLEDANTQVVVQSYFRPGPIAPGMKKRLDIQLFASVAGEFSKSLEIKTEKLVYIIPITGVAKVGEAMSTTKTDAFGNRMATRSPHHVPPLDTTAAQQNQRFGKVGMVRLFSENPSPRTRALLRGGPPPKREHVQTQPIDPDEDDHDERI